MSKCRSVAKLLQRNSNSQQSGLSKIQNARNTATAATGDENRRQDAALATAKPFEEIPSMTMLPFVGTAWLFFPFVGRYRIDKQHIAFREKRKQLGNVFRDKFGSIDMVVSCNADDVETMLKHEGPYPSRGELATFKAYRQSRKQWFTTLGLALLEGKEWLDLRKKTQKHLLKPKAVLAYLDPMQTVARDFVSRMSKIKDANNEIPNFLDELSKWSLESISYVGLDTRLGCFDMNLSPDSDGRKMVDSVRTQFESVLKLEPFAGSLPFWKLFPTPTWKKFVKQADIFMEIAFKYIHRAMEDLKTNKGNEDKELTLLQCLLASKELSVSEVTVTVTDLILTGIDTTSNAVGFLLYNLAKNPDKQELLYQEIIKSLPTKEHKITPQIFSELSYLKACMKESHRHSPIVFTSIRQLDHDVVIGGYRVPAGKIISVILQEIGQDERYFKNADSFIPERWLNKSEKTHPFALLPFGFGTRSCIGRRIAELEIICLASEVIRNFKVEYHHEDIDCLTRLVNIPDRPMRLSFIER